MVRIIGMPGSVILLFVVLSGVAVAVMVAFGYFASHAGDTAESGEDGSSRAETTDTATTPPPKTDGELTDLAHVGEERANTLREVEYESVADVAEADRDALTEVDGIGSTRVERIAESADTFLEQQSAATTESDGEPSVASDADDTEDERPRATVTFEPETTPDEAERETPRLGTIFSAVFGDSDTDTESDPDVPSVEQDDSTEDGETDADSPVLSNAGTRVENGETDDEDTAPPAESTQSALARAKVRAADGTHEVCGRVRMLFDRRVVDLRAYGVVSEWDELTVTVSDGSPVTQEPLAELIDLDELAVECPTDSNRVRVSQETVAQLEDAAERGRPEAKRSVTLLRRVLRGESSGIVVRRFASEEGSNVTVE